RWDYNQDGQYTNHIDINNDGKVDVRDWEIGGCKFSNNYGGGPSWGNEGFCYMMYKTLADAYGEGGIWNNAVHVLYAKENTEPLLTTRITLLHICRKMVRVRIGVSDDPGASYPDFAMEFPVFNFQGGCNYMQGGTTEEDKTINFGLDLTFLLNYFDPGTSLKYFLLVDEIDPDNLAGGIINRYSIIDYANGGQEIECNQYNVPLVNNGTTILDITHTVNFDTVFISTEELPDATVYENYSYQLDAGGGNAPYTWDFDLNYSEINNTQTFPNINTGQLTPSNNSNGYALKQLDFSFPFYNDEYNEVKVYVDGHIMVNEVLTWPYHVYDFLAFTKNKLIAPFLSDLKLVNTYDDGIWYEGNSEYAIFRWKASIEGQIGESELNFAVKLYKSGQIEYFYGNINSYNNIEWISGLSNGDNKYYQFTEVSNDFIIPPGFTASLNPVFPPGDFTVTRSGVFSGYPKQTYDEYPVKFMVTDRDNLINSKVLYLSTDGTNYLVIKDVAVHAGIDEIIEYGETVSLTVTIENLGAQMILGAQMEISSQDPYISFSDSTEFLGDFNIGEIKTFADALSFDAGNDLPNEHEIIINTLIKDSWGSEWISHIDLTGYAPEISVYHVVVDDGDNGILDPGETTDIIVTLINQGGAVAENTAAEIFAGSQYITVNQSQAFIGTLSPLSTKVCLFNITASSSLPLGYIVDFGINITAINDYIANDMFYLVSGFELEDFESGGFLSYPWEFGGEADWIIGTQQPFEGVYCAVSGDVEDDESSSLEIDVCFLTGGEISFVRKVSSEDTYDFLMFYIDGFELGSWCGEQDWAPESYMVSQGIHTLKWAYEKDYSISNGDDCGWVDYIKFPPFGDFDPILLISPDIFDITLEQGESASDILSVTNQGSG
ncbi:MAG: hypothetical protein K8R53_08380, partial [Bacteroidales bacterium]|nr:hypothetical protein [Bacteroidales bacterium]